MQTDIIISFRLSMNYYTNHDYLSMIREKYLTLEAFVFSLQAVYPNGHDPSLSNSTL